jgi:hypothetical protein
MSRLKKIAEANAKARAWKEPETGLWMIQPEGCAYFADDETIETLGITWDQFNQAMQGMRVLPHPMDEGACFKTQEEAQTVADNINKML